MYGEHVLWSVHDRKRFLGIVRSYLKSAYKSAKAFIPGLAQQSLSSSTYILLHPVRSVSYLYSFALLDQNVSCRSFQSLNPRRRWRLHGRCSSYRHIPCYTPSFKALSFSFGPGTFYDYFSLNALTRFLVFLLFLLAVQSRYRYRTCPRHSNWLQHLQLYDRKSAVSVSNFVLQCARWSVLALPSYVPLVMFYS